MIWLALLAQVAAAPAGEWPVRLHGGAGGGYGPPSAGGHVLGRVTLHGEHFDFEAGYREALMTDDPRLVGAIFLGPRYTPPGSQLFTRFGFAHNHEAPLSTLMEDPAGTIFGGAEGIRHRSGLELGGGVSLQAPDLSPLPLTLQERLAWEVSLSMAWFPDDDGPHVYGFLDVSGSVGVGRRD